MYTRFCHTYTSRDMENYKFYTLKCISIFLEYSDQWWINLDFIHTFLFLQQNYGDYSKYLLRSVETFQAYLLLCCVIQEWNTQYSKNKLYEANYSSTNSKSSWVLQQGLWSFLMTAINSTKEMNNFVIIFKNT